MVWEMACLCGHHKLLCMCSPVQGVRKGPACAITKGRWSLAPASLADGTGVHVSVTRSHTTAVLQHQETLSTSGLIRQGRELRPGRR